MTDLSAGEIVTGKLAARLVPAVSTIFCGLPFLSLGGLLGGIEPAMIAGSLAVTLGAAVLGCALAFTLSVWGTKMADVVLMTYAVWLVVTLLPPTWLVLRLLAGVPRWPLPWWLEETNPILLIFPSTPLPPLVGLWLKTRFLMLVLLLSAVLAALATRGLRASVLREPKAHRGFFPRWRFPGPSLDTNPVLWREWQVRRPGKWGMVFAGLYFLLAAACTVMFVSFTLTGSRARYVAGPFLNGMQVLAGLLLLSISAASSLAEERVRGSLDVLLTTPLSTRSIVWAKWWGTYRAVPLLAIPPAVTLMAVVWENGHWLGLFLVIGLVLAYGAVLTSLGLAIATWVPRAGRCGACAAGHVMITVGWVLCVAMFVRTPGVGIPCRMSFSPFMGVALPTIVMQRDPRGEWAQVVGWLSFWIVVDLTLAALLMIAVLATFDRCLGRARDRSPWHPRQMVSAVR